MATTYSVFHQFKQAKFTNGGSILNSNQFLLPPQLPQKNEAHFKSVQNWLKNNRLDNNTLNLWNSLYLQHTPDLRSQGVVVYSFTVDSNWFFCLDLDLWMAKHFQKNKKMF